MMDLRMCHELALKLHLLQFRGSFVPDHKFEKLLPDASAEMQKLYNAELPGELESYSKVNRLRYGEQLQITPLKILRTLLRIAAILGKSTSSHGPKVHYERDDLHYEES